MLKRKRVRKTMTALNFDEDNIQRTNPLVKDYGLAKACPTSTPYPLNVDPITPQLLRIRLEQLLEDLNVSPRDSKGRLSNGPHLPPTLVSTPSHSSSTSEQSDSVRSELFRKKRQEFCRHEFTIAKQRNMNYLQQQPGTSNRKHRTVEKCAVSPRSTKIFESKINYLIGRL